MTDVLINVKWMLFFHSLFNRLVHFIDYVVQYINGFNRSEYIIIIYYNRL